MSQLAPLQFVAVLKWLDRHPLLPLLPQYVTEILEKGLYTFRLDGSPQHQRVLTGAGKKNLKTLMAILASFYKLFAWQAHGHKGNQIYYLASDQGQADDTMDLAKKLIRANPALEERVLLKQNVIERRDGVGFIEALPAGDADGLHGKTWLFRVISELHTQRDYRVLEALEFDRTRPDAVAWHESYAAVSPAAGMPLNDMLKQHAAGTDPRLYVAWFAGSVAEANPALDTPLGPTMESIEDARRALPSWIFRRLYENLPGQPDGAAYAIASIEACTVPGRKTLPPQPGVPYRAFEDTGLGGADDWYIAIGHLQAGVVVVDLLMDQGPRTGGVYDPKAVVKRHAEVLTQYGCTTVTGDRAGGHWPRNEFAAHGITYLIAEKPTSELYGHLAPMLDAGQIELPDNPKLVAQLIGLVRRGDKVVGVAHDDASNAVAGLAYVLRARPHVPLRLLGIEDVAGKSPDEVAKEEEARRQERMKEDDARIRAACLANGGVWFPGDPMPGRERHWSDEPDISDMQWTKK